MQVTKRRRYSPGAQDDTSDRPKNGSVLDEEAQSAISSDENSSVAEGSSISTEDEIEQAQRSVRSKKTQKRKRRATSPSQFGSTLQNLLNTDAPSNIPLSLKPSIAKQREDQIIEKKAKRLLEGEKKEKEEKGHIADVIGGWGGESERSFRKVAQRGVVKLFNAIQQAQLAAQAEQEEAKTMRGSGKPTLPAPAIDTKRKAKKQPAKDDNVINQDAFLQMIRSGGIVSRS